MADAAAAPGEVAIGPPPVHLTGPVHLAPPPAALRDTRFTNVVPGGGTWAVVIGINDYAGSHDLRSAVADAEETDRALALAGVPGDHRVVIRNGQATAATIMTAADWLVAHASKDATAVFFYAGHARTVDSGQVLVGADGRLVSDTSLADHLRPLRARRAWIAIASCYGGGFNELLAPGRVLTAAAPAGSIAYETSAFNHSYLVEYMVKRGMVEGQGGPTVQSAFAFAKNAIAHDYPRRQPVQMESAAENLVLAPPGATPQTVRPSPAKSQPPPAAPPPSTPPTTAPPPADGCAAVTIGLVRCGH